MPIIAFSNVIVEQLSQAILLLCNGKRHVMKLRTISRFARGFVTYLTGAFEPIRTHAKFTQEMLDGDRASATY